MRSEVSPPPGAVVNAQIDEIGSLIAEALRPPCQPMDGVRAMAELGLYGSHPWPDLNTADPRKPTGLLAESRFVEALDRARREGDTSAIPYLIAASGQSIDEEAICYAAEMLAKESKYTPPESFPGLMIDPPGQIIHCHDELAHLHDYDDHEPTDRKLRNWRGKSHTAHTENFFQRLRTISRNFKKLTCNRSETVDVANNIEYHDIIASIPDEHRATPWEALDELGPADRVVVDALRTKKSVAEVLGVSERQARRRIARAEKNLLKILY